jgi:hypothetical protein
MDWLSGKRVAQGTVPALFDAVQGEYFTVHAHAALALKKADNATARIDEEQR